MRSFLIPAIIFLSILHSCDKNRKTTTENEIQKFSEFKNIERIECYGYLKDRDTIYMALHIKNDTLIEGDLSYSLNEKDSQKGSIRGRLKGDSLFADYTFSAEGKNSIREVFFLRTGKGFMEGSTASIQKKNRMVFTNKDFDIHSDFPLIRMDCR
ncbi:hypothetical protein [Christiangramia aquimixticola]|uniref:hypothetical protein n=1 Tax=Christiangramia aquimixticola TaxID=1697558 RepID=UPI003AA81E6F